MYSINEAYALAAEANARHILVKALFNGTTELTGDNIIDMTVTEATNASDGLSMGATIASKLVMSIKMPDAPLLLEGGYVQPYVGFYGLDDYCPLGKFYITEAVSKDDFRTAFTITGYDSFSKTEKPYTPTIDMPNTPQAILTDIASQCGFSLSDTNTLTDAGMAPSTPALPEAVSDGAGGYTLVFPETPTVESDTGVMVCAAEMGLIGVEVLIPLAVGIDLDIEIGLYDYTCRQYIGYIAGLAGKNARFDRNGELSFVWYTDNGISVGRDLQFMGGFKRLTSNDVITASITSGAANNVITAGTGVGFSFENPFMTQDRLNELLSVASSLSYTPATLKWRGNPMVEAGDIIVAEDAYGASRKLCVMEQTLHIGGGMYSEIKCYGKSEAEINFETSPQEKKLQQLKTELQDVIAEATKLLQGANGGVFEILDENGDGINDGWIIRTVDDQQHIKANVNGIGITTNGGQTYEQAITVNGINASAIHTGHMSAERITVGDATLGDVFTVELDADGHPVVTIGSSGSDIKQKQTSDAVTFVDGADNQVARFSVSGAEWADMQEMRYCGFVWTKSNTTGNVRFTKASEEE